MCWRHILSPPFVTGGNASWLLPPNRVEPKLPWIPAMDLISSTRNAHLSLTHARLQAGRCPVADGAQREWGVRSPSRLRGGPWAGLQPQAAGGYEYTFTEQGSGTGGSVSVVEEGERKEKKCMAAQMQNEGGCRSGRALLWRRVVCVLRHAAHAVGNSMHNTAKHRSKGRKEGGGTG